MVVLLRHDMCCYYTVKVMHARSIKLPILESTACFTHKIHKVMTDSSSFVYLNVGFNEGHVHSYNKGMLRMASVRIGEAQYDIQEIRARSETYRLYKIVWSAKHINFKTISSLQLMRTLKNVHVQ